MRGRGRSAAGASRWKGVDVLSILERSKDAGVEKVVRGGVARWSEESDSSLVNEDDTLYVWSDPDLLPNGAVMISARKATFDERWPYTGRRGWRPTSNKADALEGLDQSPSTRRTSMHTQQDSSENESDTEYRDISPANQPSTQPKSRRTRKRATSDDHSLKHTAPVHAADAKQQPELADVEAPPIKLSPAAEHRSSIDAQNSQSIPPEKDVSEGPLHKDNKAKRSSAAFANVSRSMEETGSHDESQSAHNITNTSLSQHSLNSTAENQDSGDEDDDDDDRDSVNSLARSQSSNEHGSGDLAGILDASRSKRRSDAAVPTLFDNDLEATAQPSADTQHDSHTEKRAKGPAKGKALLSDRVSNSDHVSESHSDDSDQELEHMPELRVVAPSMPSIDDFLPMPFPHKRTKRNAPAAPDPNRTTVVDWIGEQQSFLLDTMRERIDERLTSIRERNAEERQRLEKKLRSQ
ncbi:hypothetical protein MPSI1_003724 [Malassezia psittaci]|uniref:Uncharacterized protein n=1 Tax=Malassezia psittaci TaxID=1821823 RepID=A0AAF0FCV9_9BASI|nr:hypothetical protein MPSI1_003724 [Malassezia psittaci]